MKLFFKVISWILHPLLMPTYAVALVFLLSPYLNYSIPNKLQQLIYLLIALSTLILPVLSSFALLRLGYINSLEMETTAERRLPFMLTAICYFGAYYLLKQLPLPKIFYLIMLGAMLSVVIALMINYKWKISIHMIGIGGITGALFGMSQILLINLLPIVMIAVLLAGLLGSSRIALQAHSPAQVYTGYVAGFACTFFIISSLL